MAERPELPSPSSALQHALLDATRARLSRIALTRPAEIQKKAEAYNARGVLTSSIAVEGYLALDIQFLENLSREATAEIIEILNSVGAQNTVDWDYARSLIHAAIDSQASIAADALTANGGKCEMRDIEVATRRTLLDKALAVHRQETDARFGAARLAAAPRAKDEHRAFMELAVAEARKCVSEDGRTIPMVGVVVVQNGMILTQSHRGEGEPGRHAEFVALENKLRDESVAGATLYTTLEPCTSRNPPKIPCALRVVERRIQKVVIGMLDPDPRVHGKGYFTLRDAGIEVELFPNDLMSQVEDLNREFSRSRRAAAAQAPAPTVSPAQLDLKAGLTPRPEQGKPGYDLSLANTGDTSVHIATLALEPPTGFGINKGGKSGGWHQEPTLEGPRILLEQELHPGDQAYVGRLCLFELNRRLTKAIGIVRWRAVGRDTPPAFGNVEVNLEMLLPPQARAALSTSRKVNFKRATKLEEIAYRVVPSGFQPALLEDAELGRVVLKSANPTGDAYIDIPFDPPVSLDEVSTIAVRLKGLPTPHFMVHVGLASPDRPELFITFKLEDGAPRQHSDSEWIVPLGTDFLKNGWVSLERNVRDDVERFFGPLRIRASGITLVRLRGDYLLDSVAFKP